MLSWGCRRNVVPNSSKQCYEQKPVYFLYEKSEQILLFSVRRTLAVLHSEQRKASFRHQRVFPLGKWGK